VPDNVLYNVFSNAEVLIGCNKEFMKGLELAFPNGVDSITAESRIGQEFTKMGDYFKMYKVYCSNQQTALNTVEEWKKKHKEFKNYLDVCHSDSRCKGLFLQSFLIKPIQRVCKYPLLLKELLRHTPEDHPDYQALITAYDKIREVVDNINEGQRTFEGLQRIIELQNTIAGVPDLVTPNRRLHKEGEVQYHRTDKNKGETRYAFVLSDLIVLCQKKSGISGSEKYEFKMSISLDKCKLVVMADNAGISNAFQLEQESLKHKCILSLPTLQEMNLWIRDIKSLIKEFQKRQLRDFQEQKKRDTESPKRETDSPSLGRR